MFRPGFKGTYTPHRVSAILRLNQIEGRIRIRSIDSNKIVGALFTPQLRNNQRTTKEFNLFFI